MGFLKLRTNNTFLVMVIIAISIAYSTQSFGSHLMGGSIEYEFVQETAPGSGIYTYRVIVKTYTNCDSTSLVPLPANFIRLGIYHESDNPNADKVLFQEQFVTLTDSSQISPELPVGCGVGFGTCIYEGVYETTVDLPSTNHLGNPSNGYHFVYIRCCRNGSILNLQNASSQGMVFYAFLGPPDSQNNSPSFADQPLPFICINDSVSISNAANEINGDSLVYSFIDPYDSYVGQTSAAPAPPNPLPWPLNLVNWQNGGYSSSTPFGPGGMANINANTGLADYFIPTQSNYVIAVEIQEYRNGQLIGSIRRDIQFLGLQCPPNEIPHFGPQSGSGQSTFAVDEGDQLCFQILFNDSNNDGSATDDSIFIETTGNLFDPLITNPTPTVSAPSAGVSPFFRTFCWNTGCNQGSTTPYNFTATATDNGCPNKSTPVVYTINVSPFLGPATLFGEDSVCQNQIGSIYEVDSLSGVTHVWSINGGTITSGSNSHQVTVNWGNGPTGSISYHALSPFG
ncbi:MAG: hypothetical protein MRY83_01875, partial [Flavobacteriales bacterium]|nr:hypothetical protein [Flavobacteriales bacterium]